MKKFLSGSGILVPIFYPIGVIVGLGAGGFLGGALTGSPDGTVAGALAGSGMGGALLMWLYATTLGRKRIYPVIDQTLRRSVLVERSSSFFFMSPGAWGVIATVVAMVTAGAGGIIWYGGGEGGALLHKSEGYLANAGGNTAYGNPAEGESVAMVYSTLLNSPRKNQLNIEVPAARQPIRVFCHISTHGTVFIVHVIDLQKYSPGEKWKLKKLAWAAAQLAAGYQKPAPAHLAVAVRGRFLYDEMQTGSLVPDYIGGDAGIEQRHGPYATRVLYPFFAASILSPELNMPPLPTPQPVAASPNAPPPPPSQAPPGPPAVIAAPTSAPSAIVPVAPATVAIGLPTPVCDWTSADGRPIRASLVRFTDATGTVGEFKREDGATFIIPTNQFSPADKAELQRIFNATKGS